MCTIRGTLPVGAVTLCMCGVLTAISGQYCPQSHLSYPRDVRGPSPAGDPKTGDPLRVLPGEVAAVAFAPDGETVAADHLQLRLWDPTTGRERCRVACNFERCEDCGFLAFSPDGTRLVSVHRGGSLEGSSGQLMVFLWEVAGRHLRNPRKLLGHYNRGRTPVYQASFSPDGKTLAAGTADETVYLWDTATGRRRLQFKGGVAACFSAEGRTLTTLTRTGQVRHWNPDTGQRTDPGTATSGDDFIYVAHTAFAPKANRVVVSDEYTLDLKDLTTGRTVRRVDLQGRHVWPLAFSADGQFLAVNVDGRIWLLDGITGAGRSWCSNVALGYQGVGAFSDDGQRLALGEKKILSIRELSALLARRQPVPALPTTEPEGVPLEARLIARQDTYVLDLGGLTAEEVRTRNWREYDLPQPRVDLVCVLRNVGNEPLTIPPEKELSHLDLCGDGAINLPSPGQIFQSFGFDGQAETPGPVTLYPGERHEFPVTSLKAYFADRYWLTPGEYTLHASCRLTVSPAPRGAELSYDESGWVTLRCAPLKLHVVGRE